LQKIVNRKKSKKSKIATMSSILKDKSFRLSILLTFIFMGVGFAFLHFGWADYSWILFALLPVTLGLSIGTLPDRKWAYYGSIVAAVIFMILLIIGHLEGFICVLMTLPIVVPLIFVGSVINHLYRKYNEIKSTDRLSVLILPLVFFLFGAPLERFFKAEKKQIIDVKTERIYPFSSQKVYNAIKNVDTLVAEKPFLMKIDLPIPQKCILEKEEVGGLRTCYFSGGKIIEKITELEPAKVLRMDVIDYQLTGRKWLGFKEAIYYFEAIGADSCKLTRITTYTSELSPRIYWESLEKMGIQQEHDYVFDNLMNDLIKK
jgi:hypothetical protein